MKLSIHKEKKSHAETHDGLGIGYEGHMGANILKAHHDLANKAAQIIIEILPAEAQSGAGIDWEAQKTLCVDQGYTAHTEKEYTNCLASTKGFKNWVPDNFKMLKQEIDVCIDVLQNYITLMQLNREHKRLSIFLPFTYSDSTDAIDPIGYIYDGINQLALKQSSQDVIVTRLKGYVEGGLFNTLHHLERVPLLVGVQREVEHLLQQYQADPQNNKPILYPCKKLLEDIIDEAKIEAILSEIAQHLPQNAETTGLLESLARQIDDYVIFIKTSLLPYAPEESFLPSDIYRIFLKLHGVDAEPEAFVPRAHKDFYTLYGQYQSLAKELAEEQNLDTSDPCKIMKILETQDAPSDPEAVVNLYLDIQNKVTQTLIDKQIISLPKNPVAIRVGTPAEELVCPMPHVHIPPFIGSDGTEQPEFVLCDLASNGNESAAYALTVHEGCPGHVLQFSILLEKFLAGESNLIRTFIAQNSVNIEGWAHYTEYLMLEHYPSKGAQLAGIRDQLLRIGRLFLDPELNSQKITYQEAKAFVQDTEGFPEAVAKSEADRYSFRMPAQAPTYRYGAIQIMDLRETLEQKLGDRFNLKHFHDAVIHFGCLPIAMTGPWIEDRMLRTLKEESNLKPFHQMPQQPILHGFDLKTANTKPTGALITEEITDTLNLNDQAQAKKTENSKFNL